MALLEAQSATLRLARRVDRLERDGTAWRVDGLRAAAVVLATSAAEAARLAAVHAPAWSAQAAALRHEPIVTVYARSAGCVLPQALLALHADDARPAQFVFDRGRLDGADGLLAFVISGAGPWVERGSGAVEIATLAQAKVELGAYLRGPLEVVRTIVEKRATFACTPAARRPAQAIAPALFAAGDYVDGPFPATLEGAVRSGVAAARAAARRSGENSA